MDIFLSKVHKITLEATMFQESDIHIKVMVLVLLETHYIMTFLGKDDWTPQRETRKTLRHSRPSVEFEEDSGEWG